VAAVEHLPGHGLRAPSAHMGQLLALHAQWLAAREDVGVVVEQSSDARAVAPDELEGCARAKLLVAYVLRRAQMAGTPRATGAAIGKRGVDYVASQKIDAPTTRDSSFVL